MINKEIFNSQLGNLGTVIFCDVANEHCWNIIMETNESTDEVLSNIKAICDSFLIQDYPTILTMVLVNNIFKASYFKEPV